MSEGTQHISESASDSHLPLSSLLSQVLVAYTIEVDNEFEHRMPHRTASFGPTGGGNTPWLVSLAMWENSLRYLTAEGVMFGELQRLARLATNLDGMRRWGYITIESATTGGSSKKPGANSMLRLTSAGLQAQEVWRPLPGKIERRWCERFGEDEINRLRQALWDVVSQVKHDLPDFLPILGYGLTTRERLPGTSGPRANQDDDGQQSPTAHMMLPYCHSRRCWRRCCWSSLSSSSASRRSRWRSVPMSCACLTSVLCWFATCHV